MIIKKKFRLLIFIIIISVIHIKIPSVETFKVDLNGNGNPLNYSVIKSTPPVEDNSATYKRFDHGENIRYVPLPYPKSIVSNLPLYLTYGVILRLKPIYLILDLRNLILQRINSYFDGSKYKDIASFKA